MSPLTPITAPLGPPFSVLDEATLSRLPAYLPQPAQRALQEPTTDLVLASISAGQLVRAGDLRAAARTHLARWLVALDEEALDLLASASEHLLGEAADRLGAFVSASPEARELLEEQTASPVVENEQPAAPTLDAARRGAVPAGWLAECIEQRDRAESLLVVLGKAALESEDEGRAQSAAESERQLRLQLGAFDDTWRVLLPVLGDHLTHETLDDPWLRRIATLQVDLPWLALVRGRQLGPQLGVLREASATAAPSASASGAASAPEAPAQVATSAPEATVLRLRLPRRKEPARPMALAAHSDRGTTVAAAEVQYLRVGDLHLELGRPDDPKEQGDFTLSIWVSDSSNLDLSGDAVVLQGTDGAPIRPLMAERKPRRWWGYFQGEGTFLVRVQGVPSPIQIAVHREA